MEDQGWRRQARRQAPLRVHQASHDGASPRGRNKQIALPAGTAGSANKPVLRPGAVRKNSASAGTAAGTASTVAPPSRWKEMRQGVRIKATMETDERRVSNARIADLCEEDREKVAKLVRRIVEVTTLHEESEAEFRRQRRVLESEIDELRSHVKRDTREIEELAEKLKASLEKLRDYQERVLVLEESNELEVRHRMDTDQTMDLLKVEVDKLRKLVKKQKAEMEAKEHEMKEKHREEMERMAVQLKEAKEQLLQERKERLQEKQKDLEERLQRSASTGAGVSVSLRGPVNRYDEPQASSPVGWNPTPFQQQQLDVSSFLNTSTELPDNIKEIMNEWRSRLEEALSSTAQCVAQEQSHHDVSDNRSISVVTQACQTEPSDGPRLASEKHNNNAGSMEEGALNGPQHEEAELDTATALADQSSRNKFDRLLYAVESTHPSPTSSRVSTKQAARSPVAEGWSPSPTSRGVEPPCFLNRSVTRDLLKDFLEPSVGGDNSFDDEVESTIALFDVMRPSEEIDARQFSTGTTPPRRLSLYESSLLDVIDSIEKDISERPLSDTARTPIRAPQDVSPNTRIATMLEGLRSREQKLGQISFATERPRQASYMNDIDLFNEVKDVYTQDLAPARHKPTVNGSDYDAIRINLRQRSRHSALETIKNDVDVLAHETSYFRYEDGY